MRYSTAIIKTPSGRFTLAGSIPQSALGMLWTTEQGAIDFLISIDVKRFQRADCSWFNAEEVKASQLADWQVND